MKYYQYQQKFLWILLSQPYTSFVSFPQNKLWHKFISGLECWSLTSSLLLKLRKTPYTNILRKQKGSLRVEPLIFLNFIQLLCHFVGDKFSTDWDKAWSSFRKKGKKTLFSDFSPDKYVSWNPRRSEFPLSEEVDPIKRTERSNLMLWTSPRFTLAGAIVIVTFLLVYTILAPIKWTLHRTSVSRYLIPLLL